MLIQALTQDHVSKVPFSSHLALACTRSCTIRDGAKHPLTAMVEAIVCGYPERREQGNLGGRGSKSNEETTPKTGGRKSKGNTKEKREHKVLMAGSA